jgi:hypothetical protein
MGVEVNPTSMVVGILVLVLLVLGIIVIWKSFKNKTDLGVPFLMYLSDQNLFILTFLCLFLAMGTTMIISGFHPEGVQNNVPPAARTIGHLGVELVSYIFLILAPKEFSRAWSLTNLFGLLKYAKYKPAIESAKIHGEFLRKNNITFSGIAMSWFLACLTLVVGMTFPILNIYIMAWGLDQSIQVNLFFESWIVEDAGEFFSTVRREYLTYSYVDPNVEFLPRNYSPFKDMFYPLQLLFFNTAALQCVTLIKGMKIMSLGLYAPSSVKFQEEKKEEKKETDKRSKTINSISLILQGVGFKKASRSYEKYFSKIKAELESIVSDDEKAAQKIMGKVGAVYGALQQMKKSGVYIKDHDDYLAWQEDVQNLFQRSPKTGDGFGITVRFPE